MQPVTRGAWRSVRYLLLVICAGGVLAAEDSWLSTLRLDFVSPRSWFSSAAANNAADLPVAVNTPIEIAPRAEMSMSQLLNGLLFSRPANGWRLASLDSPTTRSSLAWMTQDSSSAAAPASLQFSSTSFLSSGLIASRSLDTPRDPDGGPTITGTWISNASGNWGTPQNWQGGTVPQGSNARARFDTLNITTNVTVTNEVARTIGDIVVGDTNGTNTYNITGATIIFDNIFDGTSDLSQIATSAGDTISAPLLLANDLSVFNSSTNVLTLSGAISSNAPANESTGITFWQGNVNVTGNISDAINRPVFIEVRAGVVTLSGTNSYTRPTSIDGGTLLVNGDNSASTGTVFVRGEGSVLGGTGTIGADVVMFQQSTITGGTTTTVGTLTLQKDVLMVTGDGTGGTYLANLSGATSDLLAITGQFVLGQGSTLNIQGTADGISTYILATFASHSDTFQFVSGIPDNYFLVYNATDLELVPIPEPSTWIGAALALAALGFTQRRRLRRK